MPKSESQVHFVTTADGRRRPAVEGDIEPEYISKIQVVRDGHLRIKPDPNKPAATPESREGRNGVGNTLGSFILGEVFGAASSDSIDVTAIDKVSFPGAVKIQKQRFKKLTPIAKAVQQEALAQGPSDDPAGAVEEWLLCLTKPGSAQEIRNVHARLVTMDTVQVLQIQGSFPVYPAETRVTMCPAGAEDPSSAACSGHVIACLPSRTGCNVVFTPVTTVEKEAE
jgi:hypothetical protein